tara:strand:- start:125 stop:229 length:105 start_codon:yes stop_codon:yes gene_type:complete
MRIIIISIIVIVSAAGYIAVQEIVEQQAHETETF